MRRRSHKFDPNSAWRPWKPSADHPWDMRRASHLIRRAGFGLPRKELQRWLDQGVNATLDELFSLDGKEEFDQEMAPMERVLVNSQEPLQLASWWLLRMLQTPCQLLEKATLFWHGHFATGAEKVANSKAMLAQNRLLRKHALGHFEAMVQGISRDVAMLIYLDSEDNRKTRPNENYARELMELFCLGPGHYTEKDIKQIARCFTGWQVYRGRFRFNEHQHDDSEKRFLGRRGNFSGEEAVRIVLDQPAAPSFIAAKLIRYYVSDEIPADDPLVEPIADQLRKTDFDIGRALRTLLGSRLFFSDQAIGRKVRSPVELGVGMLRNLQATANMNQLRARLRALGHLPLYPPNVKGWEGGRRWINASTYFGRTNLVRDIVNQDDSHFAEGSLAASVDIRGGSDPEAWVPSLVQWLVPVPLPSRSLAHLQQLAEEGRRGDLDRRVADVLTAIGATPEFQLS